MTNQYSVQFSEEDLFHVEGAFCRMEANSDPRPATGQFVVKRDGIYEIAQVIYSMDNCYDVYMQPIVTQTQDGDIIVVADKERYYRCMNANDRYGFKKVTVASLLKDVNSLRERFDKLEHAVASLVS